MIYILFAECARHELLGFFHSQVLFGYTSVRPVLHFISNFKRFVGVNRSITDVIINK